MALSQKSAAYDGRDAIVSPPESVKELARHVLRVADDLASQVAAVRIQGNFGQTGAPSPPHPVTAISVVGSGGFATVRLTHANPPLGTQYVIEHDTTPNFQNPVQIDNGGSLSWQAYKAGQTLYFRAAPKFIASPVAEWTYFGPQNAPTPTTF